MKYLKIWTNEEDAKKDEDGQLYLKLHQTDKYNDIYLSVFDKTENIIDNGKLLMFSVDTKLVVVFSNVSDEIPIKTDKDDYLIIITDEEVENKARKYAEEKFKRMMMGSIQHQITESEKEQSTIN